MKNVNKVLFFWSYLMASPFSTLFINYLRITGMDYFEPEYMVFTVLGFLLYFYTVVLLLIFVYKMWQAIPAIYARTTPEKAIGFLFIPIFNFYWLFQAFWGWAKDWNSFAKQSEPELPRTEEAIAFFIPVFALVNIVIELCTFTLDVSFGITMLLGLPSLVLILIFLYKVSDLLNSVPAIPVVEVIEDLTLPQEDVKDTRSLASFILGGVSIIGLFIPQPYGILFGPICSIIAIILAKKQRKIDPDLLSKTGLITGIIGLVLWGLDLIVIVILLISNGYFS